MKYAFLPCNAVYIGDLGKSSLANTSLIQSLSDTMTVEGLSLTIVPYVLCRPSSRRNLRKYIYIKKDSVIQFVQNFQFLTLFHMVCQ
jgi:hypothetical protein